MSINCDEDCEEIKEMTAEEFRCFKERGQKKRREEGGGKRDRGRKESQQEDEESEQKSSDEESQEESSQESVKKPPVKRKIGKKPKKPNPPPKRPKTKGKPNPKSRKKIKYTFQDRAKLRCIKKPPKQHSTPSISPQKPASRRRNRPKQPPITPPITQQARYLEQVRQQNLMRYGVSKFIKRTRKNPTRDFPLNAKETLKTMVTWWIEDGKYLENDWPLIFRDMQISDIRDLRLFNNHHPKILREISHVRFGSLEILNLGGNRLKSIELLSRMRLSVLRDLTIRENHITNINCLFRMNLQHLENLNLTSNYICQADRLFHLNSNRLQEIFLDWRDNSPQIEDVSWLVKLKRSENEMHSMHKVVMQAKERIGQKSVDFMIGQKYNRIVQSKTKNEKIQNVIIRTAP